jgi:stage II sporulation protein D
VPGRLLLTLCLFAWALPSQAQETVRIAVATGAGAVEVGGAATARPLREGAAARPVGSVARIALDGQALLLDGQRLEAAGVLLQGPGLLRLGGLHLSGTLEVRRGEAGLDAVNVIPLEDYVAAVLGAEMYPWFPAEALRAQAVAARTYALHKKLDASSKGRAWHLGATVLDQVYRGQSAADPRTRAAARATSGEILTYGYGGHEPIEAYFHSACGGQTERGRDALGRDLPYLKPVSCRWCREAPRARWATRLPPAELAKLAGRSPPREMRVTERTPTGRAAWVELRSDRRQARLTAVELRRLLGYQRIPSLDFQVHQASGAFLLEGRGAGHGAGLCQWGAAGLAREGADHRQILSRYYPGAQIVRMY